MDPIPAIIFLSVFGIALLVAEAFLPTHGILGVFGALCVVAAVAICFFLDRWLGVVVAGGVVILSPFVAAGLVAAWKRSPIGRRLILPEIRESTPTPPPAVHIGQVGVTFSELRPMGECDFGEERVEVMSEYGMVSPGTKVKVVSFNNGRATVRAV